MRRSTSRLLLALAGCWCYYVAVTDALVTLRTMRSLTSEMDELRGRILEGGEVFKDGRGQVVMGASGGGGGDDGEEVEATVTAALTHLSSSLLSELEKPVEGLKQDPLSAKECNTTILEYHAHLKATTRFIYAVHERQMVWNWKVNSPVYDGVSWLQALWASRRTNTQERSFIEQQIQLYDATGCFGKSKEVLRRSVEIVEYLNDLMDSFP